MKNNILIAVLLMVSLAVPLGGWLYWIWYRSHLSKVHQQTQIFLRRDHDREEANYEPRNGHQYPISGTSFTARGWVRHKEPVISYPMRALNPSFMSQHYPRTRPCQPRFRVTQEYTPLHPEPSQPNPEMPRTANQQPNPESKRQRRKQRAIQKRRMQMEKIEQNENNQQNVQSENQQWNSNNTKKGKEQKNKKENKNDEGQEHQPNSQPWPDERHPGGGITGQWHGQHHSHANDCNEEPNPWLKEDRYKRASPEHEASDQGWGDEPNLRPKKNRNKRANSLNASSRRVGWESPWDRSSPAPSLAESSGLLWGKGSNCDKSPDQAGRAQSDAGSTYGLAAMGAWDDGEDKQHGWGSSSRDPDEKWYEPKWKENAKWETDGSLRQQVAEAMGTSRARENHGSPERGYRGRSPAYRTSPVGRGDYDTGWGDNNDTARKEDPQWW